MLKSWTQSTRGVERGVNVVVLCGLVACSLALGACTSNDNGDGTTMPTPPGDDGAPGASCFLTVCQDPNQCTTAGVATVSSGCPQGSAFLDSGVASAGTAASQISTISLTSADTTGNQLVNVTILGAPQVTTYTNTSVGTLPIQPAILFTPTLCYADPSGDRWVMQQAAPGFVGAPQEAIGSFTLSITGVQPAMTDPVGVTYSAVHGMLHIECEPDATTNAKGTITLDAEF
jgi:hypothetical protein